MIDSGGDPNPGMRVPHRVVDHVPDRAMQLVGIGDDHHRLFRDEGHRDSSIGVRHGHLGQKLANIDRNQPRWWPGVSVSACQEQQVLDQPREPLDIKHEIGGQAATLPKPLGDLQLRRMSASRLRSYERRP